MAVTLADLCESPDHYLHSFDGGDAVFVPMDRAAYHRSIFLDDRISPAADGSMRLPVAALRGVPAARATSWIFHVAHCGSTLLARALDRPATNLVLREPQALRQAALTPAADRLGLVAAMVSKRYRADLPTLVKANVPVNFVLPELAAIDPQARVILLHMGLRDYLCAILRDDGHRAWLGRVTTILAARLGDVPTRTLAERAAALWLAQMRAYAAAVDLLPNARSLDAELFFLEPREAVKAAADHLAVPMTHEDVVAQVEGDLFARYSKNPQIQFDTRQRQERRQSIEAVLAPEIAEAEAWVLRACRDYRALEAKIATAPLFG